MEKIIKELEQKKVELLKEVETIGKAIKLLSKKDISTAERFVLETIKGCITETKPSGNVYWYKDGKHLFTQNFKNGYLWVSYKYIWKAVREEFGLNRDEIHDLLIKVLRKYTDNGRLKIV